MKYFSIYTPDAGRTPQPPTQEQMAAMGEFMAESFKAGTLVSTGGLLPLAQGGLRARSAGGRISIAQAEATDSPAVTGWAILQTQNREQLEEITRKFLQLAGDGECVIHQIMEEGQCAS